LSSYWQRKPIFIPRAMQQVAPSLLQLDDLLRLADDDFLTFGASSAFMPTSVKSGATRSFQFDFSRSKSNFTSELASTLLKESTWLISNVHTIHPAVAQLTKRFQTSFGLAASTNVYVTPRAFPVAAPLHTDRTDAFILQAAGAKRWMVFAPAVAQPVWGVHGDGQWAKGGSSLSEDDVGVLLEDVVLHPGDMLYLPRGFPHRTSTLDLPKKRGGEKDETAADSSAAAAGSGGSGGSGGSSGSSANSTKGAVGGESGRPSNGPSIALTIALNTESMHLVYEKALRCAIGLAGLCKQPPCAEIGPLITRAATASVEFREPLPVGFMRPRALLQPVGDSAAAALTKNKERGGQAEEQAIEIGSGGEVMQGSSGGAAMGVSTASATKAEWVGAVSDQIQRLWDTIDPLGRTTCDKSADCVDASGINMRRAASDAAVLIWSGLPSFLDFLANTYFAGSNERIPKVHRQAAWAKGLGQWARAKQGYGGCHEKGFGALLADYTESKKKK
jgi:hypothetical protein